MQFEPLRLSIYTWFSETSGITTIWAEQAGPKPSRPFATLKLITGAVKMGGQDNLRVSSDGRFVLNGPRSITLRAQVFGKDALEILTTVRDSLDDPDVIDVLDAEGLAVMDDGEPSDITEALETIFEQRAVLDVKFEFNVERATKVTDVNKVGINGQNYVIKGE